MMDCRAWRRWKNLNSDSEILVDAGRKQPSGLQFPGMASQTRRNSEATLSKHTASGRAVSSLDLMCGAAESRAPSNPSVILRFCAKSCQASQIT